MPKPRNLTAAAYDERIANPASAHPKDSVSNTAPGLEFDERSIDKYVFPGLVLEFQRQNQDNSPSLPVVRTLDQDKTVSLMGTGGMFSFPVDDGQDYLYVYAIRNVGGANPQTYPFYKFSSSADAVTCWDAIRNLPCEEGGRIALLIGVGGLSQGPLWKEALRAFNENSATQQFPKNTSRDSPLIWAVVVGPHAPWEDATTGLIFPEVPPGDLQSTMCTPWHYDFRDCHCYYWASNRPDMVSAEGPEARNVHYMRKRKPVWEKTPVPLDAWGAATDEETNRRNQAILSHVETINGWESLPVVLDDTETRRPYRKVLEKLQVLAGIEHALTIEYLYAYHSINPAFELDGAPLGKQAREVILKIATDEMRHFRWVNEILVLLDDRQTIIDRADNYGPNFDWRCFERRPLDQTALDWFIRVEKPSAQEHVNEQLEGLYISIEREIISEFNGKNGLNSAFGAEPTVHRILGLLKLIMEEGEGHYTQLADLRARLFARSDTAAHLRPVKQEAPSDGVKLALRISDICYQVLLYGLGLMFRSYAYKTLSGQGALLQELTNQMQLMAALNERLAELGYPAQFEKPQVSSTTEEWSGWKEDLRQKISDLREALAITTIADTALHQCANAALASSENCCPDPK